MSKRNVLLCKSLVIILALIPYSVFGQLIKQKSLPQRQKARTAQFPSPEESASLEEQGYPVPIAQAQAMEKIVDPEQYIVGPGDLFYINISIGEEVIIPSQVTPEGKLVIETIGTINVDGKTLAEVQREVRQAGTQKYTYKQVTANLVELRTFRIHVLGEVNNPGTYLANPMDRVSVLIDRADALKEWADDRKIEIRHVDGKLDTLDFFEFKRLGKLEKNIFVQSGDVIYVPAINLSKKTVSLEGNVRNPGIHQITDGEMLSNFLRRMDIFTRTLDPHNIFVIRKSSSGEEITLNVNLLAKDTTATTLSRDIELQDGDQVRVPSLKNKVYVHGAVNLPGGYSYMAGFSARDYVGLAGGTSEMGNIKGIKVIHHKNGHIEDGPNAAVERGDTIIVPLSIRQQVSEYLQILAGLGTLVFAFMAAQK